MWSGEAEGNPGRLFGSRFRGTNGGEFGRSKNRPSDPIQHQRRKGGNHEKTEFKRSWGSDSGGEMIEHLERIPKSRPNLLRVSDLVADWKIGDTYTATITFTLVKKERAGMILNILDFKPTDLGSGYTREDRTEMKVVPSPS